MVTSSDVVLEILQHDLRQSVADRQPVMQPPPSQVMSLSPEQEHHVSLLWGSPYKSDQSDDFKYIQLSRIIMHMEHGSKLILKDVGVLGAL